MLIEIKVKNLQKNTTFFQAYGNENHADENKRIHCQIEATVQTIKMKKSITNVSMIWNVQFYGIDD